MTTAEQALWAQLRARRPPFRRQRVIAGFIVDFVSLGGRLIIEVDGGIHQGQQQYDLERDAILTGMGYRILRVTNDEVLSDPAAVVERILALVSDG